MKSLLITSLMTLSATSMALTQMQAVETLESKLSFSGYVEVNEITTKGAYSIVEFYVGSYGEERLTSCVFKYDQVIDCKDNWFNL